jgi:hypothetical protein
MKSAPIDASLRGHAARFYRQAAERWREFGNVLERAYALLGQGRCLAALGDPEAEVPLREAREFLESMGYKSALRGDRDAAGRERGCRCLAKG